MQGFLRRNLPAYFFLTPWLVGFFLLAAGPVAVSIYLGFTDYKGMRPPQWVGLDNYLQMLNADPRFVQALQVTFTFVLVAVPAKLALALAVALALDKCVRTAGVYSAILLLPAILGSSVGVAILWRELFHADGPANTALGLFGISGPDWLADPRNSLWTLIVLVVWQMGVPMLIFLAGLRAIPQSLYEAAEVDAANRVRRFIAITIPLLAPVIFFNLVLQMIDAFKTFSSAFILTDGRGAPMDSLLLLTIYIYDEAFSALRFGYASALATVLLAIVAALTALAFWTSRYWVHDESGRS